MGCTKKIPARGQHCAISCDGDDYRDIAALFPKPQCDEIKETLFPFPEQFLWTVHCCHQSQEMAQASDLTKFSFPSAFLPPGQPRPAVHCSAQDCTSDKGLDDYD